MPPPGSSTPPPGTASGAFSLSGAYPTSQNPVHRALRLLKTQLNLAIGQREEDPERAWLEAVSVRDRLETLAPDASEDAILQADVDRFRGKLEQQLKKLTRDVGDEVVAPLYSWVDLLRQRDRLELEVDTARTRVLEARASRGAPSSPHSWPPSRTPPRLSKPERVSCRCGAASPCPRRRRRPSRSGPSRAATRCAARCLRTPRSFAFAASPPSP